MTIGNEFNGENKRGWLQRIMGSRVFLGSGGALLAGFVGVQFVSVEGVGENPAQRFEIDAPPDVKQILVESCYDCHSNEVRWPWYSRVAPMSWLVVRDVEEGRDSLNFSNWGEMSEEDREFDKETAWEVIEEGEMPLWFYVPIHPEAALTDEEKAKLKAWLLAHENEEEEEEEADSDDAPEAQDEQANANAEAPGAGGAAGANAEAAEEASAEKKTP